VLINLVKNIQVEKLVVKKVKLNGKQLKKKVNQIYGGKILQLKKNQKLISGISRNPRIKGEGDSFRIKNLRLDKKFAGLTNDRGWISYGVEINSSAVPNEDVVSIYYWEKRQGEDYLLYETTELISALGPQMSQVDIISKNSTTPLAPGFGSNLFQNTPNTIYLPLGNSLGIFNVDGYAPQKYYGTERIEQFGCTPQPSSAHRPYGKG
jgi:hypothetical protein